MTYSLRTLCVLLGMAVTASAERLPTRNYGLADGLPSTFVGQIATDSRGLLWLSTRDGLARFDGVRFVTYGTEQGLPVPNVSALLESRRGEYWVATNGGGVCRMNPEASRIEPQSSAPSRQLFRCTSLGSKQADHVNTLHEDAAGRIYAGTDGGLFRLEYDAGSTRIVQIAFDVQNSSDGVSSLLSSGEGDLWIGTREGLVRIDGDGSVITYRPPSGSQPGEVREIARDRRGGIWVAYRHGLLALRRRSGRDLARASGSAAPDDEARWFGFDHSEMGEAALAVSSDGRVWVGTTRGVMEFDGEHFRRYGGAHGLTDSMVLEIAEDRDGNLWIAALSGLTKLNREGFVTYDETDGLPRMPIHALVEDAQGRVVAGGGEWVISRFESGRFVTAKVGRPGRRPPWASQLFFLDRQAEWWMLGEGLVRFGRVNAIAALRRRPAILYTERDGLSTAAPFRLFEDSRGDLWIGGRGQPGGLARWERKTGRFHSYPEAQGNVPGDRVSAFCDVGGGEFWIGFYEGGLLRYRDGRFARVKSGGVPRGMITAIHRDAAGRLWIGSNEDGLTRVDDPVAAQPHFVRYSAVHGLTSNNIRAVTSGSDGTILAGSVRGLYRLDPRNGVLRYYTMADGLAGDFVTALLHDGQGRLWVGTLNGLSKLLPGSRAAAAAPPVWIDGLRIGGVQHAISHMGQASVDDLVLSADRNQVQIDFYSVGFRPGQPVRYQYRIEGVEEKWNAATTERTVHYSRLAPGRYRFLVRAVTADGLVSPVPARVDFTILPPVWQRWWFRATALVLVGLVALAGHRHRVRRIVETERVRTRIASDLHDDIGSSLSQIAILSEVVRTVAADDARVAHPLGRIARLSRESVDAMGDIVWAIDPHRDTPDHLAKRMRRFASDLLPPCGIELGFEISENGNPRLGPDVRREVFLIFKEALNNVVRHACATRVDVALGISPRRLQLTVADNGNGFRATETSDGQGLRSMRRRAEAVGGTLDVQAQNGSGARLTLTVVMSRSGAVAPRVAT